MTLICSHSNASISTIAKHVQTYLLNLQSFEVELSFLPNKFLPKINAYRRRL